MGNRPFIFAIVLNVWVNVWFFHLNFFWYRSIILLSTRGDIRNLNISEALMSLGTAKPAYLQNKGLFNFYI